MQMLTHIYTRHSRTHYKEKCVPFEAHFVVNLPSTVLDIRLVIHVWLRVRIAIYMSITMHAK